MDKNNKSDIKKSKDLPIEKEKAKGIPKDETELKTYKIPDANNKKYFDKINNYNIIGIMKYIYFPEMVEISFVNHKFYNVINKKYPKRIPLIKISLKSFKNNVFFNFAEDFNFVLKKNSLYTTQLTRKMTENFEIEYFPKMKVKKYFFSKMKSNPDVKKLFFGGCEIGKKSMKYLSYYFNNSNCNIKEIDISRNKITGEIIKPLAKNPNIQLDNLIANKCINDIKTLMNISNINTKKLSLMNDNLDNELISKLINNNITEINLSHNYLSNEGVFCLCKNLPYLKKLNLANNNICDLSLLYISLYIKNQKNKLTSLNLKDNKITITGLITFLSTLENINKINNNTYSFGKLNLSGNLLDLVPIPKRLGTNFLNVRIKKLCLGNHSFNINDLNILLDFINNIQNISILDLSQIVFDNVSLNLIFNRVSENVSLKKLKLKNCYLGNTEVYNTLETYYSKSRLKKERNKYNNKYESKNSKKNEFIQKDNIINEKIEEYNNINEKNDNKIEINNNKEGINEIKISNNINNNTEKINYININLDKIEKIDNNKNDIDDNNFSSEEEKAKNENEINNKNKIDDYLGVESLDLGYNFINYQKLDKIIISNHIKELYIEGNDLNLWGNDLILFFDYVINNKVLEVLNLNKNNLQKMANKLLEKMYDYNNENNSNCHLKILSLEDNQIKDINLELTNLLSNSKNLEILNIRNNLIGDEIGNNYFFHSLFLSKYSNIKEIDISDNKISLIFLNKIIKYNKENIIEGKNFVLNITSKQIREAYLNTENKEIYKELVKLKTIKCL
jgi:hypothetical protein